MTNFFSISPSYRKLVIFLWECNGFQDRDLKLWFFFIIKLLATVSIHLEKLEENKEIENKPEQILFRINRPKWEITTQSLPTLLAKGVMCLLQVKSVYFLRACKKNFSFCTWVKFHYLYQIQATILFCSTRAYTLKKKAWYGDCWTTL